MIDAVIFDVDGTLCDVETIRHLVTDTTRNFDAFHRASVDCPPHQWVIDALNKHRADGKAILIVTARQFQYRWITHFWLKFAGVGGYDQLYMRPDGDYRPDADVKAGLLRMIKQDGYNPTLAYEDRLSVAEVWKSAGIEVVMVGEGV